MENLTSLFEGKSNLSWGKRVVYVIGGLGLTAAGAQPRPNPLLNVLALAGGSYLAYSGYTGHCPAKAALFDAWQPTRRRLGPSLLDPTVRSQSQGHKRPAIYARLMRASRSGWGRAFPMKYILLQAASRQSLALSREFWTKSTVNSGAVTPTTATVINSQPSWL